MNTPRWESTGQVSERPCVTCGWHHEAQRDLNQPDLPAQWLDPSDGHPLRQESWESIARRLGYLSPLLTTSRVSR